MKKDSIQQMLERYREGTLDDSGLSELNRLAQRDEVMEAAEHRANGIIRRRRTAVFTVTGLLVAGAAVWTLLPAGGSSEPMLVAATDVPEMTVTIPAADSVSRPLSTATPAVTPLQRGVGEGTRATRQAPSPTTPRTTPSREGTTDAPDNGAPVVVCNNQCEADSVISDIWKFLTV